MCLVWWRCSWVQGLFVGLERKPSGTGMLCMGGQLVYKFQLWQRHSPQPKPQTPSYHLWPNHIILGPNLMPWSEAFPGLQHKESHSIYSDLNQQSFTVVILNCFTSSVCQSFSVFHASDVLLGTRLPPLCHSAFSLPWDPNMLYILSNLTECAYIFWTDQYNNKSQIEATQADWNQI